MIHAGQYIFNVRIVLKLLAKLVRNTFDNVSAFTQIRVPSLDQLAPLVS